MKQVKLEKKNNWYVLFQWGNWGTHIGGWSKVLLRSACVPLAGSRSLSHSWDILTSEATLAPHPAASLGRGSFPELQMCFPRRAGVPWELGTAAAREGASPGQQHCPELGMQWSSTFCLALVLLTKPYHSVLGWFFKPYSFNASHRVATPVWGSTGAVAESSIPLG